MTDRSNDDQKTRSFETESTVERSNRSSNRGDRRERPRRESVGYYAQATSASPAGNNLSWGSIFAGAVSGAACFATLSLLTAALGFGLFSPTNASPLSGVGIGTGIWTAITLVLSFLAGGFVAGYSARSTGKLHGAVTWAVTLLLLLTLVFNAVGQLLGVAGNIVGTAANVAGNVAGSAISATSDAVSAGVEKAGQAIGEVDTTELQANVEKYLQDTDIPELQPEYLNDQLQESKDEIGQAVKDIAVNPNNANTIISDLASSLGEKAKTISDSADRDAIANAVAQNTDLTQAEAEEVTDNIYNGLVDASEKAQVALDNASKEISKFAEETQANIDQTVENAKEGAESATNSISIGAVIAFLGLVASLALSAWGGQLGEQKALEIVKKETIR